jgi:hypothetical protein
MTFSGSWDSIVSIANGYRLEGQGVGVLVLVQERFFSSPCRPDWFWGPPTLLFNGYRRLFPQEQSSRRVKLTTHLQEHMDLYTHSPIHLHSILLN